MKQENIGKLIIVLTIICVVSAVCLAFVYKITKEPIAKQKRMEMIKAIRAVLPETTVNDPLKDKITIKDKDIYIGKDKNGKITGVAFKVFSNGFGGTIEIMLGIRANDNSVNGIQILTMSETPGLGAKIEEKWFKDQFKNKNLKNTVWKVKKDGGDIDQITGATISPRAVTKAIYNGLKFFEKNKKLLLGE
jgi:electron transport complex protein RnfG